MKRTKNCEHICSESCVDETIASGGGFIKLPDCLLLINHSPLAVPFKLGWKRITDSMSCRYVAPCKIVLASLAKIDIYLRRTKSQLSIEQFSFDPIIQISHEPFDFNVSPLKDDITEGKENVPVSCVNDIDVEMPPSDFQYSYDRVPDPDVVIDTSREFLSCCDCTDNCVNRNKCACVKRTLDEGELLYDTVKLEKIGYHFRKLGNAYQSMIFECNDKCPCNNRCSNRVVQNGIKWNFQVFKTADRGWGLRTLQAIPCGQFICLYSGQLISHETIKQLDRCDDYVAELDYITGSREKLIYEVDDSSTSDLGSLSSISSESSDSVSSSEDDDVPDERPIANGEETNNDELSVLMRHLNVTGPYAIDGNKIGNIGRFLNHSCDPSCRIRNIFLDSHDYRFPYLAFFTIKNIFPMEELTWDYRYSDKNIYNRTKDCKCRSAKCRQRMY